MAKVRYKNIKRLEGLVIDLFEDAKRDERNLIEVAEFAERRIQQQTRLGKSLPNDGKPLKPLKSSYVKQRERTNKQTDREFFSPGKSNLTFTGQLLKSLRRQIIRDKGLVKIMPKGTRDDGLTNQKVAEFVKDGGRPFLGLDEKASNQIKKIILKNFRRLLRSRF